MCSLHERVSFDAVETGAGFFFFSRFEFAIAIWNTMSIVSCRATLLTVVVAVWRCQYLGDALW